MDGHRYETQYEQDDIKRVVDALLADDILIRTADLAEELGCTTETARAKLDRLADEGYIVRRKVSARGLVYHYPIDRLNPENAAATYTSDSTDVSSSNVDSDGLSSSAAEGVEEEQQSSQPVPDDDDESVSFFPGERMISVTNPSEDTINALELVASLEGTSEDNDRRLYRIEEEDVWTAPHDDFDSLLDDLRSVVGEEQWYGGFETYLREAWEHAHTFELRTASDGDYTVLSAESKNDIDDIAQRYLDGQEQIVKRVSDTDLRIVSGTSADVKESLYESGYPVIDKRRLDEGASLDISLTVDLRDYQEEWVSTFRERGQGVFCAPSGSGKTIGAIGTIADIGQEALIIVPRRELVSQWKDELLDKTDLSRGQIGEYHGGEKQIRPITIATYQTATMTRHRDLFNEQEWGIVIADEAHHAPASTFRRFRNIQSRRRLGLSATPVRETENPKEVFSLIGPPIGSDWGRLFDGGWVAKPDIDVAYLPWSSDYYRDKYNGAEGQQKMMVAAQNPAKTDAIKELLRRHSGQKALIFVDSIDQGQKLSNDLDIPFVYGETSFSEREEYYQRLRDGDIEALIVSRVGDEGIDLPDAEVAIMASTRGSSRQQTGQRGGRTMRPEGESKVYLLLTRGSGEQDWGRESTQYLVKKGSEIQTYDWENRPWK